MRYTLHFNCHLQDIHQPDYNPETEWINDARDRLEDSETWYNYIFAAFEHSMNNNGGEGEPVPNISNMFVSLENTPESEFDGSISWDAEEVDYDTLQENLMWFIDDRMSFYEVCGEEWHCFVNMDVLVMNE